MKDFNKNLIPIIIIIAAILVAGAFLYINQGKTEQEKTEKETSKELVRLSPEEVAEKVITFINEKGGTASVVNTIETAGVYKIRLKIGKKELTVFVTKDGKFLFPEVVDLNPPPPPPSKEIPKKDVSEARLFVMSFCPFGNQAEELMMPVVKLLGEKADIKLDYVIYSNYASGYPDYCLDKENKYCSMHGIGEINQDIRELCVQKYQKDKLWDFIKEINKSCSAKNVDAQWEEIAQKIGIDVQKIKECQDQEGKELLSKELELTEIQYQVQNPSLHKNKEKEKILGSPALVINDMIYDGDRSSEAYKEAICLAFKNPPVECSQKLTAPKVDNPGSCK